MPGGLPDYYNRLLRRMSVGSLQAVLTPLMPPLLEGVETLRGASGRSLLNRALIAARVMLNAGYSSPETTQGGAVGYTLYHESLRDHLLDCRTDVVKDDRLPAYCAFADAVVRWNGLEPRSSALSDYCMRFGIGHLVDAAIECMRHGEDWPDDAAEKRETASQYVKEIGSLLTNPHFDEVKLGEQSNPPHRIPMR